MLILKDNNFAHVLKTLTFCDRIISILFIEESRCIKTML